MSFKFLCNSALKSFHFLILCVEKSKFLCKIIFFINIRRIDWEIWKTNVPILHYVSWDYGLFWDQVRFIKINKYRCVSFCDVTIQFRVDHIIEVKGPALRFAFCITNPLDPPIPSLLSVKLSIKQQLLENDQESFCAFW